MIPPRVPARGVVWFCCLFFVSSAVAQPPEADQPKNAAQVLASALHRWADLIEPPSGVKPQAFVAKLKVTQADGLPADAMGATAQIAFEAPAHLKISATVAGSDYSAGRDGNQIWIYEPGKKFAVLGKQGVARFHAEPQSIDNSEVPPFSLPITRQQLALASLLMQATLEPRQQIDGADCQVLRVRPLPAAAEMLHFSSGEAQLFIRESDQLPARIIYSDGKKTQVQIDFTDVALTDPLPADTWKLHAAADDKVETVAVSHLVKFIELAPKMLTDKCPTLGPATGQRRVVATEGKGRLENIDGTRVLFLKGSPEEMGHQHGVLLKKEIHSVADRILYGVGVGSSFARGSWFFGEIEGAEARLEPFMDPRYLAEEDAIAAGAGMDVQEARLANFFPELFHCSGFAVFGKATKDGHIYHGRVLDYLKGVGLEQNAVVIVHQPDYGNAWVNLSYAGFVGSITAMNEKGISIGEMGGKGYGDWDGRPMAHLMREVMEKASTLDEAIKIMRDAPRTCQYYYVIADGKARTAVGVAANAHEFVTIKPGEYHPLLPTPEPDTVMLSAGRRYETLAGRVKENYGAFDADSARKLMDPPVCMSSNIQSVLFEPDTLDLWVANADSKNVASLTRYTHYNLHELLKSEAGN
jgi:isopenicillin-N N-acyltransferase-like protein